MTKASDNVFPRVIAGMQTSDQSAPSDSSWRIYAKANGIFARSSNGIVGPFAGSGLSNPMTTTGDVIYSSDGSGTPARRAIGSNSTVLGAVGSTPNYMTPPGFEFDYVERHSTASITATSEGAADTFITGNAVTYDGSTSIIVEFFAAAVTPDSGAAGRQLNVYLYDGSSIGRLSVNTTPAASSSQRAVLVRRKLTPSAGAHTYSIRAAVNSGTGTISAAAGGSGQLMPAYLRITKA